MSTQRELAFGKSRKALHANPRRPTVRPTQAAQEHLVLRLLGRPNRGSTTLGQQLELSRLRCGQEQCLLRRCRRVKPCKHLHYCLQYTHRIEAGFASQTPNTRTQHASRILASRQGALGSGMPSGQEHQGFLHLPWSRTLSESAGNRRAKPGSRAGARS